ncbi:hypothetical protein RB653_003923 [Dictyostelium firmibasis]|uniref:NADH dehydrogenase [ubiquinone] 1 alpha subcomplex assembly factor 3 n=1 Tax=Dictyostelium firmibasis TaxID=79012 RepID=A0AAN7U5Q8_9MYCE
MFLVSTVSNYCKGIDNGNIFEMAQGDLSKVYNIDGYVDSGFSVNKTLIPGSINIMPQQLFLWDIHSVEDITIDTLSTLDIVEPPTEFLLIGTGATHVKLPDQLIKDISNRYKLNVETMTTMNAIGTYNILAEEERRVSAFILPHVPLGSKDIREPYLVSKNEYLENIKDMVDKAPGARPISKPLTPYDDPTIILQKKKQTLLKMKLDEVDKKSISLIEKEIEKLEKLINNQQQQHQQKVFKHFYIPTRNTEEGFVSTNQSQGEKHQLEQEKMNKIVNPFEKSSKIDKFIIWFVKFFGQKK